MRRALLKFLIAVMFGIVTHDYFIKQCDIIHTKKCDILQDHSKHQLFHLQAVVDQEPLRLSDIEIFDPQPFVSALKSQFIFKLSPPPPKRS